MEKAKLQERYQLFIGGQWKDASAHETFKTICPADGSVLAECAQATKEDVDEAVKAGAIRHFLKHGSILQLQKEPPF